MLNPFTRRPIRLRYLPTILMQGAIAMDNHARRELYRLRRTDYINHVLAEMRR